LPELGVLLGGGLDRGTSTLVIGPAGVGKSALATQYAAAAAARGEPSAVFLFDESMATHLARARGLGMDLDRHVTMGVVALQQIDPAELPPGAFVQAVHHAVESRGARVVVIDSLNGYLHAMPEEKFLLLHLHELLGYLGQRGVVTLLLAAQHGIIGHTENPVDVSYLADCVILLRYFETEGAVRQAISVLKRRTGRHERTIRELRIEPGGMRVGPPLVDFEGVLTGTPRLRAAAPRLGAP
jgi:circadian clock protein KaiC